MARETGHAPEGPPAVRKGLSPVAGGVAALLATAACAMAGCGSPGHATAGPGSAAGTSSMSNCSVPLGPGPARHTFEGIMAWAKPGVTLTQMSEKAGFNLFGQDCVVGGTFHRFRVGISLTFRQSTTVPEVERVAAYLRSTRLFSSITVHPPP